LARRLGWSEEQLQHLDDPDSRAAFSAAEQSALHLAETMTRDPQTMTDGDWAELRSHFNEGEVVELISAIGMFNYFNRVAEIIRLEPTK